MSPTRPLSIRLPLDLLRRLALHAREGLKAVPRRGLEVGGILLGRCEKHAGYTTLHVQDFAAVESEHRSGPSYVLSEPDRRRFEEAVATHFGVIGIFRTQTRSEDLNLESDDRSLFNEHFTSAERLFLLIQPSAGKAAIFLPADGELAVAHEFPLEAATSAALSEPDHAAEQVSPMAPSIQAWSSENLRRTLLQRRWLVPAATAVCGAVIAAGVLQLRHGPAPEDAATRQQLGLTVERQGRGLKLAWDRGAPSLLKASRAKLSIIDGSHTSNIDLDAKDIRAGGISYWPDSGDVSFRLEVDHPGGTEAGSVRFVAPVTTQAATAKPSPVPPKPGELREREARESEDAATARRVETLKARKSTQPKEAEPESQNRVNVADRQAPAEQPSTQYQEAANHVEPAFAHADVAVRPHPPAEQPPRPAPKPIVSVTAEPVKESRISKTFRRIPLLGRLKKSPQDVEAPRPLKEVQPTLTPPEERALTETVPVEVRVFVTESGSVDFAELVNDGNNPRLAAAAVSAARKWNFSPAKLGGENVPGEMILHFRFKPATAMR